MKPWKCPNCGEKAGVPVLYGLPTGRSAGDAHRGDLVLGGCVLTDDDPPRCCTNCRAALWPGGIHAVPGAAGDLRIVLAGRRNGRRLVASVSPGWDVTIAWSGEERREEDMAVAAGDVDFLLALMAAAVLTDGATIMRWLARRRLGFVGGLKGIVDRYSISSDGMASFGGIGGDILVHSSIERVLLHLIGSHYRRQGFRSIAELNGWLQVFGLDTARST